ncbi:hypothetical protein D9M71_635460 [compost metagenome]
MAMVISTIAAPNSRKPGPSKVVRSAPRKSGMNFHTAMQPSRPTGRLSRKIQCQLRISTSQPPTVGPSNGPSRPGMVMKLMIRTSSLRG